MMTTDSPQCQCGVRKRPSIPPWMARAVYEMDRGVCQIFRLDLHLIEQIGASAGNHWVSLGGDLFEWQRAHWPRLFQAIGFRGNGYGSSITRSRSRSRATPDSRTYASFAVHGLA